VTSVPILLYHHVAPDREVTPAGFKAQLAWLKSSGRACLSGAELLDHLTGRRPAPPGSVMLTFDDGYADNWIHAFPALKRHGLKATIFVVTGRLSRGVAPRPRSDEGGALVDTRSDERGPRGFLDWSEARAMAESGLVEIGSHTETHKDFRVEAEYADLPGELERSRKTIESETKAPCLQLAWPWGRYEESWPEQAAGAGYALVHTTRPGANVPGGDPLRLARFKVQGDSLPWLKRRLALYEYPLAARLYGGLYGLDRRFRSLFK
jgi:peptidoglycan/xylan/chitin deacetylase (PgdA/CDA1 family)